jgi:hypothetical protein
LTSLVKKLDQVASHSKRAGAFVILLTDDDKKAETQLKQLAEKEKVKKVMLGVESPQGPPRYKIAKDAGVTVILYEKKRAIKSLAFEKGSLSDKDVAAVVDAYKGIAQK